MTDNSNGRTSNGASEMVPQESKVSGSDMSLAADMDNDTDLNMSDKLKAKEARAKKNRILQINGISMGIESNTSYCCIFSILLFNLFDGSTRELVN